MVRFEEVKLTVVLEDMHVRDSPSDLRFDLPMLRNVIRCSLNAAKQFKKL